MLKQLIDFLVNLFKKRSEQQLHLPLDLRHNDHRQDAFNLPPGWEGIDSVVEMQNIPNTGLNIGQIARVVESPTGERVELNLQQGMRSGCDHFIYQPNPSARTQGREIGGVCIFCQQESHGLLLNGMISKQQAEERSIFCSECSSYCLVCFRKNLCARHTQIFQSPDGRFIPVCPACFEQLNPNSLIARITSFLSGK